MSITEALFLGIIQGITEFLPISSSGHLLIFESFFGLEFQELRSFDVMVHLGTLLAVLVYFRKDIWAIIKGFFRFNPSKEDKQNQRLGWYILLGSLPAAAVGFTLNDVFDHYFRNITVVGVSMILVGVLFFAAEKWQGDRKRSDSSPHFRKKVNARKAFNIGMFQALALVPGVSRSGATIAAGLLQKVERTAAARFSFLLGAPAMFGAGLLTFKDVGDDFLLVFMADSPEYIYALGIGFLSAAITGFFAVSFLMKFLKNHTLNGFGIYLIIIGALVLIF